MIRVILTGLDHVRGFIRPEGASIARAMSHRNRASGTLAARINHDIARKVRLKPAHIAFQNKFLAGIHGFQPSMFSAKRSSPRSLRCCLTSA